MDNTLMLLASLDAEFGRKTQRKEKEKAAAQAKPKKAAEAPSQQMDDTRYWIPIAVVHHLVLQQCQCCGETTEYLGNTLIRHQSKLNPRYFRDTALPHRPSFDLLPTAVEDFHMSVPRCPSCIRAELVFCEYPSKPRQLTFFGA